MVNLTWSMSIFELLDRRAKGRLRDIMNILRKDVEGFKVTHCYKKILAGKTIYNGSTKLVFMGCVTFASQELLIALSGDPRNP